MQAKHVLRGSDDAMQTNAQLKQNSIKHWTALTESGASLYLEFFVVVTTTTTDHLNERKFLVECYFYFFHSLSFSTNLGKLKYRHHLKKEQ